MKVFFDTEVFLCGVLLADEPFGRLFASDGGFTLAMSDQVFSEILDVIRRSPSLRKVLPSVAGISLPDIFNSFEVEIARIPPSMTMSICKDPGDNKYLASAMYLECDYLVTAVPDLLALENNAKWDQFRRANGVKCRIVGPDAFLTMVAGS